MSSITPVAGSQRSAESDHRWLILVIVAIAQLMVVLDSTVVNIALPSAQRALGFPNSDRQWVVTAYALAFGSLLLVGGRLGDMFSRKRVFITGLAGFALSSALGGAATSFGTVVLNPLATLFSQTSFCADRICMFPPLRMATSLTGGGHHHSFRRRNLHYPLDA